MLTSNANRRPFIWIIIFGLLELPSCILRFAIGEMDPLSSAFVFGIGIIAGAFLISWAAEAAQLDISASFAIAILALITILPKYANSSRTFRGSIDRVGN